MILEIDTVAKTIKVKDATLSELTAFMTKNSYTTYKLVFPKTEIYPDDVALITTTT